MLKNLLTACVVLAPLPALAQTDMTMMARNGAANELGVLEFCQDRGSIDGSAVAAQKQVLAKMPAGGPTDAAEATGRSGKLVAPNGTTTSISDMADKGNTTVASLCTQMASGVKAAVVNNPAMSMTPGTMPAMPQGMPAMPAMPSAPPPPGQ